MRIIEINKYSNGKTLDKESFIYDSENFYKKQVLETCNRFLDSGCRLMLVSGPSGSGKTTTSLRIKQNIEKLGFECLLLSMDNWFLSHGDRRIPFNSAGKPDFEHPLCVDIDLLNSNLLGILKGKEVNIPHFNFLSGKQELNSEKVQLKRNGYIILEGLHTFNDYLNSTLNGYFVYISPNDAKIENIFFSKEDIRLFRRLSRDKLHRGRSFEDTVSYSEFVEEGTKKYLEPNMYKANVVLDSLIGYELFLHKTVIGDFKQLSKIDQLNVKVTDIPEKSILNEFFEKK